MEPVSDGWFAMPICANGRPFVPGVLWNTKKPFWTAA